MKKNYSIFLIFGIMCLTINMRPSQNNLFDSNFIVTTEKISVDTTTPVSTYFNNFRIHSPRPATQDKIVIAGTFQSALNCPNDWDPNCEFTELTFNSSTGLYTGTFQVPAGNNRYKVTVGGTWDINYGENGIMYGADISLCVPSNSEEITFIFDPSTNLVTTSPVTSGFSPDCLPMVVLAGSFQEELGCGSDWVPDCTNTALIYNSVSGLFEGYLNIPTGCYEYRVVLDNNWQNSFGQEGIHNGPNYTLSIPANPDISYFTYDPVSHIVSSTPYNEPIEEVTRVSLYGTLQDELGCAYDNFFECDTPALLLNPSTGMWEGSFNLPSGCYSYRVKETMGCDATLYGEFGWPWGDEILLYIPADGEITFSYDPETHIISSTPNTDPPQEVTTVSLYGTFQDELACDYDYDYYCNIPTLLFNPDSGAWEGSVTLPAGCYTYYVKETFGCNIVTLYGENGIEWGNQLQLYVPSDGEITFSYDPLTHIVSSTPNIAPPQEVTKVSLMGSLQNELGCTYDDFYECDKPALLFNVESGVWEASFTIPAGCYTYRVKETFGCSVSFFGENGIEWGPEIQLFVPEESDITFIYDPQTHTISSTPYSGAPQEVRKVSLLGTLQDELGCVYDFDDECENPGLTLNPDTGAWEGSFTLSAGCYTYRVKETFGCIATTYGDNGSEWGNDIQLYLPEDGEISFSYDPQTHLISSTPYSDPQQEVTQVSLTGTLQDELGCFYEYDYDCNNPALVYNPESDAWEGSFTLPAGCYTYMVKETSTCNSTFYGENGVEWGNQIQLYVPSDGEISFSYNAETNLISSTPYHGGLQEDSTVSLMGTLQDELGCADDYDYGCDIPALQFNPDSGAWEGSISLPAGCYTYRVKETTACGVTFYGVNGIEWGDEIQLYVPTNGEITFSYDPQTHIISSSPSSGVPQEVTKVSLIGTLQDEVGCAYDNQYECDSPALLYNPNSGIWEGSFSLPAGCYTYWVKETFGCNNVTFYGENGIEYGNEIQLFVPTDGEITFRYDPKTHILSSTPYTDISTVNQCPNNISVNNSPGLCGAVVDYPEFVATANCGGELLSITQIAGLPSGSFFPVGVTTNSFLLTNTTGEELMCSFDVVVNDTESPVISELNRNYEPLWPPNHKMVPVFIEYFATDNCNIAGTELIISSNEPVNGPGDGNTAPDWEIIDEHNVLLRAERSGKGDGREYYITIKVTDDWGNSTEERVTVTVPHDKGKKSKYNNDYILYPNGADDIINIKELKSSSISSSNSPYVIYDMLGIIKKQGTIINDQIEVRTLPPGVYILRFEMEKGIFNKKFIKN